mmetsp:Transcript_25740/g.76172  ORF Transcript_25740/g.76172 Transcript_25740/m.76172 type:complete len:220 (+) Transcript_25740:590-1249(+)
MYDSCGCGRGTVSGAPSGASTSAAPAILIASGFSASGTFPCVGGGAGGSNAAESDCCATAGAAAGGGTSGGAAGAENGATTMRECEGVRLCVWPVGGAVGCGSSGGGGGGGAAGSPALPSKEGAARCTSPCLATACWRSNTLTTWRLPPLPSPPYACVRGGEGGACVARAAPPPLYSRTVLPAAWVGPPGNGSGSGQSAAELCAAWPGGSACCPKPCAP